MDRIKIVLVGIGGYGNHYVEQLLRNKKERDDYVIVGAVDPYPEQAPSFIRLNSLNIPIYHSLEEFYLHQRADLAIISSPIHFHCQQTCLALANGSHVLCEKPVSAVIQEGLKMNAAQNKADKLVGIGYQWSFSEAITALKQDINAGKLGHPKLLKTLVLWPRNRTYFRRSWAGKQKDRDGNWILDSVANNAAAHYLHNMFFILGEEINRSTSIRQVEAELYRANNIENFDTSIIWAVNDRGVEIKFYASHAVHNTVGPIFEYQFSDAVVRYDESQLNREITAIFNDGTVKSYGDPQRDSERKLWTMLDAVKSGDVLPCGIEAALTQTMCINGAQESMPTISSFPKSMVKIDADLDVVYVEGLEDVLKQLYLREKMPSSENVPWAKPGKCLDLTNYNYFPSFTR